MQISTSTYNAVKKELLENVIVTQGTFIFLHTIDRYEKEEEYEICGLLVEVVKEREARVRSRNTCIANEFNLETKWNEKTLKEFRECFKDSETKGDIALANMPFYVDG